MKKIQHIILLSLFLLGACESSSPAPDLSDYHFILGKWNSVSTDTYEIWQKDSLEERLVGITYRLIDDTLRQVSKAAIKTEGDNLFFEMDIDNPKKKNRKYPLVWSEEMKDFVFLNTDEYPVFLAYKKHGSGPNNLNVLAGKSIEEKDYFEFLYQRMDSLPQ